MKDPLTLKHGHCETLDGLQICIQLLQILVCIVILQSPDVRNRDRTK